MLLYLFIFICGKKSCFPLLDLEVDLTDVPLINKKYQIIQSTSHEKDLLHFFLFYF